MIAPLLQLALPLALALAQAASQAAATPSPSPAGVMEAEGPQRADPKDTLASPGERAAGEPRVILAIPAGAELRATPLEQTLRGHLSDLAITPEVEPRAADDGMRGHLEWARAGIDSGAEAVFWLEQPPSGAATLYLLLGDPERLYMRALTLSQDPLESQEILGVVIRGLVSSLTKSSPPPDMEEVPLPARATERGPGPEQAPEGAPPGPGPQEPAKDPLRLTLGLGYAGSSYAAALPWGHGIGLSVGFVAARRLALTADLSWALHSPLTPSLGEARYDDARLRLSRGGLALRLGYRVTLGARRRAYVEPALALRGEALLWWPLAGSRASQGVGLRLSAGPAASAGVTLGRGFGLAVTAGLDIWLRNLDLVAKTPAGSAPIAAPSTVGANVLAGLIYAR